MLVSFWAPTYHEETVQIMTLVSEMCSKRYPCSIAAMENYLHERNLGFHLLGSKYDDIRNTVDPDSEEYYLPGEAFIRHICRNVGRRSERYGNAIQVNYNGLVFLPMNQSMNSDAYRYAMCQVLCEELADYREEFENVFINLEPNGNPTTTEILNQSDAVVVCLPASEGVFEKFYETYRSLSDKCFFAFYGETVSEPLILSLQKRMPNHSMRCCFVEMTRMLRKYLEEGHGIRYLERFDVWKERRDSNPVLVADRETMYLSTGKETEELLESESAEYIRRVEENEWTLREYSDQYDPRREILPIRSIQYISEWLMQGSYSGYFGRKSGDHVGPGFRNRGKRSELVVLERNADYRKN